MFEHLIEPRFTIVETIVDERGALLTWDMTYRIRKLAAGAAADDPRRVASASSMRDGRIAYHRDYWDAAERALREAAADRSGDALSQAQTGLETSEASAYLRRTPKKPSPKGEGAEESIRGPSAGACASIRSPVPGLAWRRFPASCRGSVLGRDEILRRISLSQHRLHCSDGVARSATEARRIDGFAARAMCCGRPATTLARVWSGLALTL